MYCLYLFLALKCWYIILRRDLDDAYQQVLQPMWLISANCFLLVFQVKHPKIAVWSLNENQSMDDGKIEFYAHTNGSSDRKDWQPLKEHLQNTANLAFWKFSSRISNRRPYGK